MLTGKEGTLSAFLGSFEFVLETPFFEDGAEVWRDSNAASALAGMRTVVRE
jgi:hypothetical protein